jgi:hypothetical protein
MWVVARRRLRIDTEWRSEAIVRGNEEPEEHQGWRVLRLPESAVERLPRPFRLQVAHHGDRLSMAPRYIADFELAIRLSVKH